MQGDHMMEFEYNKLTQNLLAQGYTADQFPPYVHIANTTYTKENPLRNFYGGFEYNVSYADRCTFLTACGLQCKGKSCLSNLSYGGIDWTFENDNPIIRCPYGKKDCKEKHPLLQDTCSFTCDRCEVHMTKEEYHYDGSVEYLQKLNEQRVEKEKKEFIALHHGRACEHQMHYSKEGIWTMNYNPIICGNMDCRGSAVDECGFFYCPILNRGLNGSRGNVFYDLKFTYTRSDLRGTFWDGQIDSSIQRGLRFFKSPVSMDICQNVVKLCQDEIRRKVDIEYQYQKYMTASKGEVYNVDVINVRAEQKECRDLMQDLQDLRDGIRISYYADDKKEQQEKKREEKRIRQEKAVLKIEKKIRLNGYDSLDRSEKKIADKNLDQQRIAELEQERLRQQDEIQHKQMNLFDFMGDSGIN